MLLFITTDWRVNTILYSKEGMLLLVQVDHLNGEMLGEVIDHFYEAGAKNVQIVSTITKKNRPSYMIFIDTKEQYAEALEKIIVSDCGSSGWHRINTCHRHTNVSIITRDITIKTQQGEYGFQVQGKVINDDEANARPEYENCVQLKGLLEEKEGLKVPLRYLTNYISDIFYENKNEIIIQGGLK